MDIPWTYEAIPVLDTLFAEASGERTRKYPELASAIADVRHANPAFLDALKDRGWAGIPSFFEAERINALAREVDDCFRTGRFLRTTRFVDADYAVNVQPMSSAADIVNGETAAKQKVNYLQISEPLYNLSKIVSLAFDERILGLMGAYLGCPPLLTYVKLQRSYVNALEPTNTQLHHVDLAGKKLPKVFLYLNDVGEGGGAFTFVDRSHKVHFSGWLDKPRWTDDEMARHYGPDALTPLFGKVGDLLAADTVGFHCGSKPKTTERTVLILSYGAHKEYGNVDVVAIRQNDLDSLSPTQRAAAELLMVKD